MTMSTRVWGGSELLPVPGWVSRRQITWYILRSMMGKGVSGICRLLAMARFSLRPIIPEKAITASLFSRTAKRCRSAIAEASESGSGLSCTTIRMRPRPLTQVSIELVWARRSGSRELSVTRSPPETASTMCECSPQVRVRQESHYEEKCEPYEGVARW